MPFTAAEKLKAAERELALRKAVFPGRVAAKKMSAEKMAHEIAVMEEIAADYRALASEGHDK